MPARSSAGVSESVGGSLMTVNWRLQNVGFSASNWHPGTYGANTSVGLDCDKSLLEVQIRIPGSDRVRSPWGMGILPAGFRQGQPWRLLLMQRVGRCDREGARQNASS